MLHAALYVFKYSRVFPEYLNECMLHTALVHMLLHTISW